MSVNIYLMMIINLLAEPAYLIEIAIKMLTLDEIFKSLKMIVEIGYFLEVDIKYPDKICKRKNKIFPVLSRLINIQSTRKT